MAQIDVILFLSLSLGDRVVTQMSVSVFPDVGHGGLGLHDCVGSDEKIIVTTMCIAS